MKKFNDYELLTNFYSVNDQLVCTACTKGVLFYEVIQMGFAALKIENKPDNKFNSIVIKDIYGIDIIINVNDSLDNAIKLWKDARNEIINSFLPEI